MAEPFIGELRLFASGVVPRGWMQCAGQTLNISTNQALYSILGNVYGGDGRATFMLPDLRGRAPLGTTSGYAQGQAGGEENHRLTAPELPPHTHEVKATSAAATKPGIDGNFWAATTSYAASTDSTMAGPAIATAGADQPHPNMQPYIALNYCIAINGIYPSRP